MDSLVSLSHQIQTRRISAQELCEAYLHRIEQKNPECNAYITVTAERARLDAAIADKLMEAHRPLSALHGLPVSYKDLIATKGIRTTNGSAIDRNMVPDTNAWIVDKLSTLGMVMLGKTNLHEYAFGITSNNPHFGPVRNPWNTAHVPGGSSGGSAAALAANLCPASIGTDTGGSIRIPSASCGVVGLKPTYSAWSLDGVTLISWSLDHLGPMANYVEDVALLFAEVQGWDWQHTFTRISNSDIRGLKIGVPTTYFLDRIDPAVQKAYEQSLQSFQDLGAIIKEIAIPEIHDATPITLTIALAEAGYVHKDNIAKRLAEFGDDIRPMFSITGDLKALDYIDALKAQHRIRLQFSQVFDTVDILCVPTIPITPPLIGQEEITWTDGTETVFDTMIRFTGFFNLTGNPVLAVPSGTSGEGLPSGIQLVAPHGNELLALKVGYAYQRATLSEFFAKRDLL